MSGAGHRGTSRPTTGKPKTTARPQKNSNEFSTAEIGSIRRALHTWFRKSRRDLPWRRTSDPYAIWLSEIMLQQTRVEAAIPYFERFLAAFPTVEKLAKAPLDRVLRMWAGLGYYNRARNLHAAAKAVVYDHAGLFPTTAAALQTLPGIGRYTAAAIASIAFGQAAAVLDGNVKRVIARLLAIRDSIDKPATIERLWAEAGRLLDPRQPGDFNQAMMELGATVCTPRSPRCNSCPVSEVCGARAVGLAGELPVRKSKAAIPRVFVSAAAIVIDGRILLIKRRDQGLLGGFWTLPGCERKNGEVNRDDLSRAVSAQVQTQVRIGSKLGEVRHEFTHRSLRMEIFAAHAGKSEQDEMSSLKALKGLCWQALDGEARVPLATVDRKAMAIVKTASAAAKSCG